MEEYLSSQQVGRITAERGLMQPTTFVTYAHNRMWESGRIPRPEARVGGRFYGWRRSTIERWLWELGYGIETEEP